MITAVLMTMVWMFKRGEKDGICKEKCEKLWQGFGIWLILLLLNTRAGESSVNGIKIIMDTLLSIILIGNNKKREKLPWGFLH